MNTHLQNILQKSAVIKTQNFSGINPTLLWLQLYHLQKTRIKVLIIAVLMEDGLLENWY